MAIQAQHDVAPVDDTEIETVWRNRASLVLCELAESSLELIHLGLGQRGFPVRHPRHESEAGP